MAESMRTVADAAMKFMGMQITGGSTTVPDGYEKLRQAGRCAETLKAAAHEKTGVHVTRMKTRSGRILPDGQELSYQSLASIARILILFGTWTARRKRMALYRQTDAALGYSGEINGYAELRY